MRAHHRMSSYHFRLNYELFTSNKDFFTTSLIDLILIRIAFEEVLHLDYSDISIMYR